jgi:hypothetical protein
MKQNEYDAAEAVEIGKAEDVILGEKWPVTFPDFSGTNPQDYYYSPG